MDHQDTPELESTSAPELSEGMVAPDGSDVWAIEGAPRSRIIALTDEAFFEVSLSSEDAQQLVDSIIGEGVPVSVALAKASRIELKKVLNVSGNEKRCNVNITYMALTGARSVELTLPDVGVQRELFDSFGRRLGTNARYKRREYSGVRSAVLPAVTGVLVVLATWFFSSVSAEKIGPTGRNRISYKFVMTIVRMIGPTGVLIIGAFGLLGCIWWGLHRVNDPPIMVVIRPGKFPKK